MYSHDDYFQTYRKPFLFLQKLDIGKPKASYMMRIAQAIHFLFAGDDCPLMLELTLCEAFSLFFGLFCPFFQFVFIFKGRKIKNFKFTTFVSKMYYFK